MWPTGRCLSRLDTDVSVTLAFTQGRLWTVGIHSVIQTSTVYSSYLNWYVCLNLVCVCVCVCEVCEQQQTGSQSLVPPAFVPRPCHLLPVHIQVFWIKVEL